MNQKQMRETGLPLQKEIRMRIPEYRLYWGIRWTKLIARAHDPFS